MAELADARDLKSNGASLTSADLNPLAESGCGDYPGKFSSKLPTLFLHFTLNIFSACRCGGIGRRKGLKIPRWQHRTGSIPVSGTKNNRIVEGKTANQLLVGRFLFFHFLGVLVLEKC